MAVIWGLKISGVDNTRVENNNKDCSAQCTESNKADRESIKKSQTPVLHWSDCKHQPDTAP